MFLFQFPTLTFGEDDDKQPRFPPLGGARACGACAVASFAKFIRLRRRSAGVTRADGQDDVTQTSAFTIVYRKSRVTVLCKVEERAPAIRVGRPIALTSKPQRKPQAPVANPQAYGVEVHTSNFCYML